MEKKRHRHMRDTVRDQKPDCNYNFNLEEIIQSFELETSKNSQNELNWAVGTYRDQLWAAWTSRGQVPKGQ